MAVDYFLKLDGIDGESQDDKHKNWIQLLSWSWGGSQTSSVSGTGGSGAGKVNLQDISITTHLDKATPKLFKSMCTGTHTPTGHIECVKAGADSKPYLKIDLKEVFVSSLQTGGSSGEEVPIVSLSFTYNEIKIDYYQQDEKGNVASTGATGWNVKQNKSV
ncbi:MAG: Hcp family type VI secretion system effector [Terracidiphilus sp.]